MKIAKAVVFFAVASAAVVLASRQADSQQSQIRQPINASKLVVRKGNVHPWAQARFDRGPAPASLPMNQMLLVLKDTPSQAAQLQDLLKEQQDPASANYRKWLTPSEFGSQFGASEPDIQKVSSWLTSQGFTIDNVAKGRNVIQFSGNAGKVQAAFHASMHKYVIDGKQYWANANDPAIPEALAPVVAGIASLNNFPRRAAHRFAGTFTRNKAGKLVPRAASANPQFTFAAACNGSGTNCYALTPYDFATIYNVLPLWTASTPINGSGQTIAIVSDSNINKADFTNFRSLFGLPASTLKVTITNSDPGVQGPNCSDPVGCNESEADVDTQWSSAVAPGATIDLVVSDDRTSTSFGGDLSAEYVINGNDTNNPSVIGYSYGLCEFFLGTAGNQFYGGSTGIWTQAAAEGITVVVSTGDTGSTGCEVPSSSDSPAIYGLAVSGIASTPYNVAVGGTDFNDGTVAEANTYWNSTNSSTTQQSVKGYIPELAYNDSCINAALDALYDSSASSDGVTNCNTYFNGTLGPLVTPFGGGGGPSDCIVSNYDGTTDTGMFSSCSAGYAKPSWQTGAGVPADGVRDLPDVAIFAGDGTFQNFYLYCEQDQDATSTTPCSLTASGTVNGQTVAFPDIQGIGGTSVSAEVFAGMVALLNQAQGSAVGLPNQNLYALAAQPWANCDSSGTLNSGCVFYQVTKGNTAMPCQNVSQPQYGSPGNCSQGTGASIGITEVSGTPAYTAQAGYNFATGLGSLNVYNLVNEWSAVSSGTPDFVISASPPAVNVSAAGQTGTTTLTITPVNNFTDTVAFSASSCSGLPSGDSCSFSTSPVSANGTTTLTIQTSASGVVPPSVHPDARIPLRAPAVLVLGCFLALAILWTGLRAKNPRWGFGGAALVLVLFLGIVGCAGSSSNKMSTVATPTFTPAAGTYSSAQTVTISDTTSGATIYYTTNSTTPTTSSTQYTGPITVSSTETIEAIAASGMTNSAVATATYTIQETQVATPTFNPAAGTYGSGQAVTISDATSGATIYYTTDGTTPTTASTQYTGPITLTHTETIEAIAAAPGKTNSGVASATYTVNPVPVAVTITGTSTAGNVRHSTTIMLTVQ
jgi:Pro-kumamolisin, activation domain/Chitobiase/beta-hexosaminidase C-terminal domain